MLIVYPLPTPASSHPQAASGPLDAFPTKTLGTGRCNVGRPRSDSGTWRDDNCPSGEYSCLDIPALYLRTSLRPDTTSRIFNSDNLSAPHDSYCP